MERLNSQRGYLLIEVLVALGVLSIAVGLMLRLMQSRIDLDRASMDRLERQLAIENIAEQLQGVSFEELPNIAEEFEKDSSSTIQVTTVPFETESRKGLHCTIQSEAGSSTLTHHVWRLEGES